ncbi:hypothetical protein [Amycolatopsis vastitatis]|uniref:Uncharacterized protein n=1 Tax=Amycolatopsis vastitatis TaxID=1905142 RepID=A0A229TFS9_9PSEU|nr:hypothetical protein [Amycolatopsis vastitatis]OXM69599.1 hypothetical protein CF165_08810 [Amycolatopsis vastitatis]
MAEQSNVVHAELYAFEVGGLSLSGSVTGRGDGRCTVRGSFEDTTDTNAHRFEFRAVPRQAFADLFRSFADNIAPAHDGAYSFWCELHVAELEGRPVFSLDEDAGTWQISLDEMECTHTDQEQTCRSTWHMGFVALDGGHQ